MMTFCMVFHIIIFMEEFKKIISRSRRIRPFVNAVGHLLRAIVPFWTRFPCRCAFFSEIRIRHAVRERYDHVDAAVNGAGQCFCMLSRAGRITKKNWQESAKSCNIYYLTRKQDKCKKKHEKHPDRQVYFRNAG